MQSAVAARGLTGEAGTLNTGTQVFQLTPTHVCQPALGTVLPNERCMPLTGVHQEGASKGELKGTQPLTQGAPHLELHGVPVQRHGSCVVVHHVHVQPLHGAWSRDSVKGERGLHALAGYGALRCKIGGAWQQDLDGAAPGAKADMARQSTAHRHATRTCLRATPARRRVLQLSFQDITMQESCCPQCAFHAPCCRRKPSACWMRRRATPSRRAAGATHTLDR